MDEIIVAIIIAFIGGGGLVALFGWLRYRKKDQADTKQIAAHTKNIDKSTELLAAEVKQAEVIAEGVAVEHYRRLADEMFRKVEDLTAKQAADHETHTAEMAAIKAAQEAGLRRYEERAGSLLNEIRACSTKLDEANETISSLRETVKENNVTITTLQNEVKVANEKIASLQDVITALNQKVSDLMERLMESK